MTTNALDLADIQGLVLRGYGDLDWVGYLFVEIVELGAARRALAGLAERVTTADQILGRRPRPMERVHVAFSGAGLAALGLPADTLRELPAELAEGMHEPERATRLGDVGAAAPERWQFGGPEGPASAGRVHAVIAVFAASEPARDDRLARETVALAPGLRVVHAELGTPTEGRREHFGFADGIAQPIIAGDPERGRPREGQLQAPLATGELVLGYPNEYGDRPWSPSVPAHLPGAAILPPSDEDTLLPEAAAAEPLGRPPGPRRDLGANGTYVAFRKLRQDVAGFWRWCEARAAEIERVAPTGQRDPAEWLAAKCIGRWRSGAPLVLAPRGDDPALGADAARHDAFLYDEVDPHGLRCPFGSHIRRSNPRDSRDRIGGGSISLTEYHRIVRRGRTYGAPLADPRAAARDGDDGQERGVLFIALCADLRRQFEFVQETWCMNPRFAALEQDPDPIAGGGGRSGDGLSVPADPLSFRAGNLPQVVTMRGGGYFFMPGKRALRFLGTVLTTSHS
jgi:Dyp-type peroxidase family